MGLMEWFSENLRVRRAGRIAKNKVELSRLESSKISSLDEKRILKLTSSIAQDEERQKIASEKATKTQNIDKSKRIVKQTNTSVENNLNYQGSQRIERSNNSSSQKLNFKKNPELIKKNDRTSKHK